jgi:hypothetical protein
VLALDSAWLAAAAGLSLCRARPAGRRGHRPPRSALILNAAGLAEQAAAGRFRVDGAELVFRSIDEIAMTVTSGSVRMYEVVDGRDLADFGLVQASAYPPPTATLLNAIAAYLDSRNVRGISLAGIGAPTRLLHYVRLAQAGLPVPQTSYLPARLLRDAYPDLAAQLGTPFILKPLRAAGPSPATLITTAADLAGRLPRPHTARTTFLAHELIPSDTALRLHLFGGHVRVAIRRPGLITGTTTSPGTLADPAATDPAARQLAARAAAVLHYDIATVDLTRHWPAGHWYILAVTTPGTTCTPPFITDKLDAYSAYLHQQLP